MFYFETVGHSDCTSTAVLGFSSQWRLSRPKPARGPANRRLNLEAMAAGTDYFSSLYIVWGDLPSYVYAAMMREGARIP